MTHTKILFGAFPPMQCIGLADIFGRAIFEGDLIDDGETILLVDRVPHLAAFALFNTANDDELPISAISESCIIGDRFSDAQMLPEGFRS